MNITTTRTLLLLLVLSAFGACKKDKTATTIQSNVWEQKNYFGSNYLYFLPNGNISLFSAFVYKLHTKQYGHYTAADQQVELSQSPGDAATLGNYRISGDSLYIDQGSTLSIYTKATTAPDTANWVKSIQVLEKYPLSHVGQIGVAESNGTDIFIRGISGNKKIYRFSMTSHQIEDSVTLIQSGIGMAYVGGGLWISDNSVSPYRLLKFNYLSNSVVNNSPNITNNAILMTSDGNKVWFLDSKFDLNTFDPVANTFQFKDSYPYIQLIASGGYADLHIKNSKLYISSLSGIFALDVNTKEISESYRVDNDYIIGLTEVNGEFWAVVVEPTPGSTSLADATAYIAHIALN
jgi:hypothetical protein